MRLFNNIAATLYHLWDISITDGLSKTVQCFLWLISIVISELIFFFQKRVFYHQNNGFTNPLFFCCFFYTSIAIYFYREALNLEKINLES